MRWNAPVYLLNAFDVKNIHFFSDLSRFFDDPSINFNTLDLALRFPVHHLFQNSPRLLRVTLNRVKFVFDVGRLFFANASLIMVSKKFKLLPSRTVGY